MDDFEKRLKSNNDPFFGQDQDSSSDDEEISPGNGKPRFATEADVLREKNRILMEKLFKADKQMNEQKELLDSLKS